MSGLFSFGSSRQQSTQQAQSFGQSFVDPQQAFFLNQLRSAGTQVAGQALGPTQRRADVLGGQLLGQGNQLLRGLQQGAGQGLAPGQTSSLEAALAGLQGLGGQPGGLAGTGLIQGAGQGAPQLLQQNPALGAQIGSLGAFLQQNLAQTAGTIAGQATLGGNTGGSRQALATGLAGQETERQFGAGVSALLGQDFATRQQLAPQLLQTQLQAGLGLQGGQLAQTQQQLQALQGLAGGAVAGQGAQTGQLQAQTQAALGGIESLPGLFNLGLAPASAQFGPLLQLAALLGDPTVLQRESSTSRGQATGSAFKFAVLGDG